MAGAELDPIKLQLITELSSAHLNGEIEVPLRRLSESLGVAENDITRAVQELTRQGLTDRLEDLSCASLSAAGLRLAKQIASGSVDLITQPVVSHDELTSETVDLSDSAFVSRLLKASKNWSLTVARSALSEEEKQRVSQLGESFFEHPAVLEILRRSSR